MVLPARQQINKFKANDFIFQIVLAQCSQVALLYRLFNDFITFHAWINSHLKNHFNEMISYSRNLIGCNRNYVSPKLQIIFSFQLIQIKSSFNERNCKSDQSDILSTPFWIEIFRLKKYFNQIYNRTRNNCSQSKSINCAIHADYLCGLFFCRLSEYLKHLLPSVSFRQMQM